MCGGGGRIRGMGRIQLTHTYEDIISVENLLEAWKEFVRGKRKKTDVQEFQYSLMDNVLALHQDLAARRYVHGPYHAFNISDPKPRNIHKAMVRDRLLHHAIYRKLYPFFDRTFIADSYSCRRGKGTHAAMHRFRTFASKVSRNHMRTCWVLKCDVRKFFASIDHGVLTRILEKYIPDENILKLLSHIIGSFDSAYIPLFAAAQEGIYTRTGLPLGNLTSQLLVNIYMNEFDQYVKHVLKANHYIRYADDFVILSHDREWLAGILPHVYEFLCARLSLALHPDKVSIRTIASGIDFLGWIHFPDHRVLRTATKRRMFARLREDAFEERIASYHGLLSHGNAKKLTEMIVALKRTGSNGVV